MTKLWVFTKYWKICLAVIVKGYLMLPLKNRHYQLNVGEKLEPRPHSATPRFLPPALPHPAPPRHFQRAMTDLTSKTMAGTIGSSTPLIIVVHMIFLWYMYIFEVRPCSPGTEQQAQAQAFIPQNGRVVFR
jgi:hypothetical protein